jgi:hypothetical protein
MTDSIPDPASRKDAIQRPKKPYPDFPLSPHPSGMWQKKIRGKIHYFGRWAKTVGGKLVRIEGDGWREALEAYRAVADVLHAGRTPRTKTDGLTLAELCNRFLTAKLHKRNSGEPGLRMFADYREITDLLVSAFGKTRLVSDSAADDFETLRATMAERWGPVRLGNSIIREVGLQIRAGQRPDRSASSVRRRVSQTRHGYPSPAPRTERRENTGGASTPSTHRCRIRPDAGDDLAWPQLRIWQ